MPFTSGMIALLPTAEDAQRYALDGEQAEPADQLHLTLQYLGPDVTGWDDDLRGRALTVAEKAVSELGAPLSARVFAHATFNPDAYGGRDPCAVYLVGDTDLLGPLREKVSLACRALLGEQHPAQHEPFVPHMTAGESLVAGDLAEVGDITFDRVGLFLGADRTELPLGVGASVQVLACRAWARGHQSTGQPADEITLTRFGAIYEAAIDGLDPVDALADGVTAGLLTAAATQRQQVHDDSRDALAATLLAFASGVNVQAVRDAVQSDAPRATRRDQATSALLGQAVRSPIHSEWQDAARDAHTLATTAGAAAAAHILSGGSVPLEPEPSGLPDPVNPDPWVEREIGGLGGDIAGALAGSAAEDVTDAAVIALLEDGAGAQYYLDLLVSQAYLDGMAAVYGASGVGLLAWRTAAATDVCGPCLAKEAGSPYTAETVPMVEHGGCRCQIVPWS